MIQIFKQVNIDWMSEARYFFALSIALLLLGGFSWYSKGRSLRYGIDFRGGTLVYVRFAGTPPV